MASTLVPWPSEVWIREIGLQVVHPGQVVQVGGLVVTPAPPRWEITTSLHGYTSSALRTFLQSLGGAQRRTTVPIAQSVAAPPTAERTQTVSSSALVEDGAVLALTTSVTDAGSKGVRAGQFWTLDDKLYEVVSVSGAVVQVVPGVPSSADSMTLASGVRARIADPQAAVWGRFDSQTRSWLGTTVRWIEA